MVWMFISFVMLLDWCLLDIMFGLCSLSSIALFISEFSILSSCKYYTILSYTSTTKSGNQNVGFATTIPDSESGAGDIFRFPVWEV